MYINNNKTEKYKRQQAVGGPRAAAKICLCPLQVDNIFVFIRQVAPIPACWPLRHQQQVDLWTFDLKTGDRVTCDVGYLCANFSLRRPLCSRVRPMYATDRHQTDRRQTRIIA